MKEFLRLWLDTLRVSAKIGFCITGVLACLFSFMAACVWVMGKVPFLTPGQAEGVGCLGAFFIFAITLATLVRMIDPEP